MLYIDGDLSMWIPQYHDQVYIYTVHVLFRYLTGNRLSGAVESGGFLKTKSNMYA